VEKFTKSNIKEILLAAGLDSVQARKATVQIINAMVATLAAGKSVELRGFGSLEVKERKAYRARNPKTREPLIAPARRRVLFHPGQELKATLRGISNKVPE